MDAFRDFVADLPPWSLDLFRLFVWLAILTLIFVPLEKLCGLHRQRLFRKSLFTDVGYYFLNGLLPKLLLILPMAAIAWALRYVVPAGVYARAAGLPLWGRWAAAMVVGEFGFYWGHRWSHEIPLLWRFHSIHHSAEQMDWLVNSRAHPLDMVFTRLCGFVPMYALGLAQAAGRTLDLVPILVLLTGTMWGFFVHSNLRWRLGPLEWVLSSPAFHHWHHTYSEPLNKNFSSMLPWVDRIFGSYYMPKKQWPEKYGTDEGTPAGMGGQLVRPFLRRSASSADDTLANICSPEVEG